MKRINDGLTKWQRYRLKDVVRYRKIKREYARTPEERRKRTEYMRVWCEKNRAVVRQRAREYYKNHIEAHRESARERYYREKYGMTVAEATKFKEERGCQICGSRKVLHIDHDHGTGRIRGVLCNACNTKVGWYERWKKQIENYLS